jgi:deoxyribonuclease IV
MLIGAHVSCSGGLDKSIDRACEIGAEAIQIFTSSPQMWRPDNHADEAVMRFRQRAEECAIADTFIHGIYLINLATEAREQLGRSVGALKMAMKTSSRIGARGVIFHVGSHKGSGFEEVLPQICSAVSDVLASTPEDSWLILENSAGMGGSIGSDFAELGTIISSVGDDRVKVCLDTCHMFAAGYEVRTSSGLDQTMAEFDREVGLDRLVAVHANDSKVDLKGGKDRHENIGEGFIGVDGFATILGHSAFAEVPLLLEVPGFDKSGPDRPNVDILRDIRQKLGLPEPARPVASS